MTFQPITYPNPNEYLVFEKHTHRWRRRPPGRTGHTLRPPPRDRGSLRGRSMDTCGLAGLDTCSLVRTREGTLSVISNIAVQWGDLENLGSPSRGLTWLRHGPHVHMAGPGVEPQLAVGHAGVGEAEEPRQHHQHSGGQQHPEGGSGQTWPGVNRLIKTF